MRADEYSPGLVNSINTLSIRELTMRNDNVNLITWSDDVSISLRITVLEQIRTAPCSFDCHIYTMDAMNRTEQYNSLLEHITFVKKKT